jgi:two-component system, OmpR family, phosphate regulon sensor histidine kinase PhoR
VPWSRSLPSELRREADSELQAIVVRLNAMLGRLGERDVDIDLLARELEDAIADIRATRSHLMARASRIEKALEAERAPDAYLVTDGAGTILESNRAASELLRTGRSLEGQPLRVFIAERDQPLLTAKLMAVAREPLAQFELTLNGPEGERHVVVRALAEEGPPPLIRWLLRDITARRHAENEVLSLNAELELRIAERTRELADTNARLWTVLQQLPDGVLILDGAGELQVANHRAEEILGRTANGLADALDGMRAAAEWPLTEVLETGESARLDRFELSRSDGTSVLELDVVPVRSADGIIAVLVVFRDVTDRERRERTERDFVTNAAHELQTPIASIASAIEVLQAGAKDRREDRDRFLVHIERAADRLGKLTRALLVLARAQNTIERPRSEVIAVEPLLHSVAGGITARTVEVRCAPDVAVIANRALLEQALASLGENAVKYTTGDVLLTGESANGRVLIEVVDRGPGIAAEHRPHVFDRFYRVREDKEGFGLGLAIVREAVDVIGGELELDSGANGTRVSIALPGARVRSS